MAELQSLNILASKITYFKIDGPALRLRLQGQASRWFPLRKIRQVCITGDLTTGTETLFKLAEQRIPVTLFSLSGKFRCQIIHPQTATTSLPQLLEEAEHDPALQQAYAHWHENTSLQIYANLGVTKGCPKLAQKTFTEQLGQALNQNKLKKLFNHLNEWLQGVNQANLAKALDAAGVPLHGKQRYQLQKVLTQLTQPIKQTTAYNWLANNPGKQPTPNNLQHAMAQLERQLNHQLSSWLNQLYLQLEQASYTPTVERKPRKRA